MKIDKTGGHDNLEQLVCVIVFDVVIFAYDSSEFSLRFVVRRLDMTGIKLCSEGLQHTMTREVGRRRNVRHNGRLFQRLPQERTKLIGQEAREKGGVSGEKAVKNGRLFHGDI
jgi:hypothetical protein